MNAISEARRRTEWAALISQYPCEFEWDGDAYEGRFTDSRTYSKSPGWGGFVQEQMASLYCLTDVFDSGLPAEGDIIKYNGLGWRISTVKLVMDFGVEFTLQCPEARK